MTAVESPETAHEEHHSHGEFIAHHFDTPRQQFDSGKLGIWLFLVTEILFFSGLFCAYTLYRAHHPEIFVQASTFLDKVLGGINTIVLLFSSLTMALAVRAAQLVDKKKVVWYLVITMVCAAIFLGVKAVEYSHKWDEGIFVRGYFQLHPHHADGISKYLILFSIPFAAALVASIGGAVYFGSVGKKALAGTCIGIAIMFGGYFLGAVGGKVYMNAKSSVDKAAAVSHATDDDHAAADGQTADGHAAKEQADDGHTDESHDESGDHESTAARGQAGAGDAQADHAGEESHSDDAESAGALHAPADMSRDIGIFFSIYYCMTGLHAFHVFGGMIALSWLLYRSILGHWRADYFGPVEFVGLYWHLVDLIWIFLFPLLYLIN